MTITLDDFFSLRKQLPIADVRSQAEHLAGHIPGTINIPILNNEERVIVGTTYKQQGQQEAIMAGFHLVGPRLEQLVMEAKNLAHGHDLIVHCWRGGMRSNNFCQFVGMAGVKTHQLIGGYKTYRQRAVESYQLPFKLNVIGGKTGSGKSEILRQLEALGEQILDLEALAHHKGSVFGGLMMPAQPTTEQFQNNLFEEILELDINKRIWIEDESVTIGRIALPDTLWQSIRRAPLYRMDVEKEVRVQRLVSEYGSADKELFIQAMEKITKKLGGQHFIAAKEKLMSDDWRSTIEILLTYYDRAYSVGMAKRERIVAPAVTWSGKDAALCAQDLIDLANAQSG